MVEISGHRGARAVAPENTLVAFQVALDLGVDSIELDVQRSKDGVLVVIHDFVVDRTTDGHGKVSDLTFAELQTLDAGSHFGPEFAGARIPSFDEVLDLVGQQCRVNVEIKTVDYRGGDEVDDVVGVIAARDLYDQVMVSSFNPVTLIRVRHTDEKIRLGLIYMDELPGYLFDAWLGPLMHPDALHVFYQLVDGNFMERAHARQKAVNAWTVNDVDKARRVVDLGVDVITTDNPGLMITALSTPA